MKNDAQNVAEKINFFKNSEFYIFMDKQFEFSYSLLLLYVQVKDYQNILKLRHQSLAFISNKAFVKPRRRSRTNIYALFSVRFWRKIFLTLYSINWPNIVASLLLYFDISHGVFMVILCYPVGDVISFEIYVFYQALFLNDHVNQDKNLKILR